MLRLTTNVTRSPASSARSESAAWRMSSTTSGRGVGEQRGQLLRRQLAAVAGALDRRRVPARRRGGGARTTGAGRGSPRARAATATRRRCTAGRRTAARSARSRRRPGACGPARATGTGARARCGRRWRSARRGRSRPRATSSGHQSARLGGTWMPTLGHQPPRLGDQALHVLDRDLVRPRGRARARAARRCPCASTRRRHPSRCRPAPRRSSGGAGRSSGG